jgi:Flp pilus assembly protein TadG
MNPNRMAPDMPRMRGRARRAAGSDRGSAQPALELLLVTPALLLIILIGVATGRADTGQSRVQQAAAAGARAATTQHTVIDAHNAATRVADESLRDQGVDCTSRTITVDAAAITTPPGNPAHITVTVDCEVSWAGLGIPGWAGSRTVTATAVSPLDPHREIP